MRVDVASVAGWLAACLIAALPIQSRAQDASAGTSLVVTIPGDKRYHQPACPLVAKAGRAVKVMKRADAERNGLTPHDCESAAAEQPGKDANAITVLVQPHDKRYHKAGCSKLKPGATKITLDEAGQKYWPCPFCKPPIRKRVKSSH